MQRAEARGQRLRFAAARAAPLLLDDFPANLEASLFPGSASRRWAAESLDLGTGLSLGFE